MAGKVKGSVTPLARMFPAEEAKKAAKQVQDAIAERRKELECLHMFASDNTNLINLVHRLPDELAHDIMVPFGKAAFFPGRLIHTNEFLVLLGDSYYAERTAKQTIDILQRRGKVLEKQLDSVKAIMRDLEMEAKFFDSTAADAKEGLVEIREEYLEASTERESELGDHHFVDSVSPGRPSLGNMHITDEEYSRIQSRLDELEEEELAAECVSSDDDDHNVQACSSILQPLNDEDIQDSLKKQLHVSAPLTGERELFAESTKRSSLPEHIVDIQSSTHDLKQQLNQNEDYCNSAQSEDSIEPSGVIASQKGFVNEAKDYASTRQGFRKESDDNRAFTGSVIEHSYGLPSSHTSLQASSSSTPNPSKPVSRFKMQRGSR